MILLTRVRRKPSLSQAISGGGMPAAVQVKNKLDPILVVLSRGYWRMAAAPVMFNINNIESKEVFDLLSTVKRNCPDTVLMLLDAVQLYSPADDKTRLSSTRTELTVEDVSFTASVVSASNREPSLNQEMSGKGIPEAEQVKETDWAMSAVVSTGDSSRVIFTALIQSEEEFII